MNTPKFGIYYNNKNQYVTLDKNNKIILKQQNIMLIKPHYKITLNQKQKNKLFDKIKKVDKKMFDFLDINLYENDFINISLNYNDNAFYQIPKKTTPLNQEQAHTYLNKIKTLLECICA